MDIYLVRHGESEANAGLTSQLDSHLTERGRSQAALTARRFAALKPRGVYVSPFIRTLETAEPICKSMNATASVEPGICEYFSIRHPDFLTFRGLSAEEITRRFPFVGTSSYDSGTAPWWPTKHESPESVYFRAVQVRDALLSRFHGDDAVVCVSHADTIGRLIEAFLGIPPADIAPWSDNCGITLLRSEDAFLPAHGEMDVQFATSEPTFSLIYQNDTGHLQASMVNAAR